MEKHRKHVESGKRLKKKCDDYIKKEPEAAKIETSSNSTKDAKHKSKSKKHFHQEIAKAEVDEFANNQNRSASPKRKKLKTHNMSFPSNVQNDDNCQESRRDNKQPDQTIVKSKFKRQNKHSLDSKMQQSTRNKLPSAVSEGTSSEELNLLVSPVKNKSKFNYKFSTPLPTIPLHNLNKPSSSNVHKNDDVHESSSDDELDLMKLSPIIRKIDAKDRVTSSDEDEPQPQTNEIDIRALPKEDLQTLFNQMQLFIPKNDTLRPQFRIKRIDWLKVAFAGYSAEKCAEIWRQIAKCLRTFRNLHELVQDAKDWVDNPTLPYGKVRNHPDYPKRPQSAFSEYLVEVKDEILKRNSGMKIAELSHLASVQFKSLSQSERSVYTDKAEENARVYQDQVRSFYSKHPEYKSDDATKLLRPKHPQTAFSKFVEFQITKEQLHADKALVRKASKPVWEKMKASKKLQWIRLAHEEYKTYVEEVKKFNQSHPDHNVKIVRNVLTKLEMQILDKADGKPIKPPNSAYAVYVQHTLKHKANEFSELSFADKMKTIAANWKLVTQDEKAVFIARLQTLQEKYEREFATYLEGLPAEERQKLELARKEQKMKKEKSSTLKRRSAPKSSKELSFEAVPSHWDTMTEDDKQVYTAAVAQLRDYFETKNNTSLKMKSLKMESSSDSSASEKSSTSDSSSESEPESD